MARMFCTDRAVSRGYHTLPPDLARTWAERRLGGVAIGSGLNRSPRSQILGLALPNSVKPVPKAFDFVEIVRDN